MTTSSSPILSVGTLQYLGARDFWGLEIGRLYKDLSEFSADRTSPFCLEVHFHVGSDREPTEFDEPRTGTVSRKRSKMWVQVPLHDEPVDNPREVLLGHLAVAVDLAEAHLRRMRIVDGLSELRELVEDLQVADRSST